MAVKKKIEKKVKEISDDLLLFSFELVKDTQDDAFYYEERKNTLLSISLAIMAFSATFMGFVNDTYLLYAGLSAFLFSFLSVVFYGVSLYPNKNVRATIGRGLRFCEYCIDRKKNKRQNFDEYYAKIISMKKKDVIYENTAHALSLMYRYESKVRATKAMNLFMILAVFFYFIFIASYFVTLIL